MKITVFPIDLSEITSEVLANFGITQPSKEEQNPTSPENPYMPDIDARGDGLDFEPDLYEEIKINSSKIIGEGHVVTDEMRLAFFIGVAATLAATNQDCGYAVYSEEVAPTIRYIAEKIGVDVTKICIDPLKTNEDVEADEYDEDDFDDDDYCPC